MLCTAVACSTLCSTLSCSLSEQLHTTFPPFIHSTISPRYPMQRVDCPRPRRIVLLHSRQTSVNRGPHNTGRHGSPMATVDGHCHQPCNNRLPMLLGGIDVPLAKNPSTGTAQQQLFLVFKVVLHAVVAISEVLHLSTKSRCSRCCMAHLYLGGPKGPRGSNVLHHSSTLQKYS